MAYGADVKFDVLGVPPGPVICDAAARGMADGVARLLHASIAVAVTGVGGPGDEEGQPAGTVWAALRHGDRTDVRRWQGDGPPEAGVEQTCDAAVSWVESRCRGPRDDPG